MQKFDVEKNNDHCVSDQTEQPADCTQKLQHVRCCGRVITEQEAGDKLFTNRKGQCHGKHKENAQRDGQGKHMANGQGHSQGKCMTNGQGHGQGKCMTNAQGHGQGKRMANGQCRGKRMA